MQHLADDPDFQDLCRQRGVPIGRADDPDNPRGFYYWRTAADYAFGHFRKRRNNGATEQEVVLEELSLATPAFLYDQRYLDRHHFEHHNPDVHNAKETASYYNGLLRSAAREWPDLTPRRLAGHLVEVAEATIHNQHLREAAPRHIHDAVRGAEHEYKFGQFLALTGRHFREARVDEDMHGVDYVVTDERGGPTHLIDVKASVAQITHDGHPHWTYERAHDGHLIMYSMIAGHELGESFSVPTPEATEKAEHLEHILRETAH